MNLTVDVVDAAYGVPAAGIHVGLQRLTVSGLVDLAEGSTDQHGRFTVQQGSLFVSALFRLELEFDRYFAISGSVPLFPRGTVAIRVGDSDEDLHLIVLVSQNLLLAYRCCTDIPARGDACPS